MNRKLNIFVLGCSHVSGHGFEDCLDGEGHSKYSWPCMLESLYKDHIDVINLSRAGNSIDYLCYDFQTHKDKHKVDGIIGFLPLSSRFMALNTKKGHGPRIVTVMPSSLDLYKELGKWYRATKAYIQYLRTEEKDTVDLINSYSFFLHWAKKHNAGFWLGTSDAIDYDTLVEHGVVETCMEYNIGPSQYIWNDYRARDFEALEDGHLGKEAHQDFLDVVAIPWIEDLITRKLQNKNKGTQLSD